MTKTKTTEAVEAPKNFKYLCPACTNEVVYESEPLKLGGPVFCPHCHHIRLYDPTRWVKIG